MKRAVLLVLLAVCVLPLAACGGGGGGGGSSAPSANLTPVAYVKSAATKSAKAPSEHMELTGAVTVAGQAVTLKGSGDFDNENHQGQLHADVNIGGMAASIDAVLDGTTIYLKSPILSAALPQGKTWIKIDYEKVGKSKGVDFSQLLAQDPSQAFKQLQGSGKVVKVGDETIDGVDTTHYRATLNVKKLAPGLAAARAGSYNVWIGKDDGYIYRVQSTFAAGNTAGKRVAQTTTLNFSDFGKDVTVDVPSDAESFDATKTGIQGLGG
jgi:hypothetical protein